MLLLTVAIAPHQARPRPPRTLEGEKRAQHSTLTYFLEPSCCQDMTRAWECFVKLFLVFSSKITVWNKNIRRENSSIVGTHSQLPQPRRHCKQVGTGGPNRKLLCVHMCPIFTENKSAGKVISLCNYLITMSKSLTQQGVNCRLIPNFINTVQLTAEKNKNKTKWAKEVVLLQLQKGRSLMVQKISFNSTKQHFWMMEAHFKKVFLRGGNSVQI